MTLTAWKMIKSSNFENLTKFAMEQSGRKYVQATVEKELLQYDILFGLDQWKLLDKLSFQGGTALRMCYGAPRHSEDLVFCAGKLFSATDLTDIKNCIEEFFRKRGDFEVNVREPVEFWSAPVPDEVKVARWRIVINTAPARKDSPSQRIHLDIANVPAYSRELLALKSNYDILPDGYTDTLIVAESKDEILVDKLVSLIDTRKYVRYRDIWDLRWLGVNGATFRVEWLKNKIADYKVDNYVEKLDAMIIRIPEFVESREFHETIARFLPVDVQERTLKRNLFLEHLVQYITKLLKDVKNTLEREELN